MKIEQLQKNAALATSLLKVMANEIRLLTLCELLDGEKSVQEMEQKIGISQSTLSQHLAILRRERLVTTRKSAQFVYYAIASEEAISVMQALYGAYCQPKRKSKIAA
ncbi:MAG: metalloregulator ArsR/SmtB family transcription factor [Hyphomicrobiales bacterium]